MLLKTRAFTNNFQNMALVSPNLCQGHSKISFPMIQNVFEILTFFNIFVCKVRPSGQPSFGRHNLTSRSKFKKRKTISVKPIHIVNVRRVSIKLIHYPSILMQTITAEISLSCFIVPSQYSYSTDRLRLLHSGPYHLHRGLNMAILGRC